MFTNIRRQNSTFSHEVINPQIYIIQFNLKKKKDVKILISDFFLILNLLYVLVFIYLNCFATAHAQCMLGSFIV